MVDTVSVTEFDLVSLGSGVVVQDEALLQPHTFEHGVLKRKPVQLGDNTVLGSRSVFLAGALSENNVTIDPCTVILDGDKLPACTRWGGVPAEAKASKVRSFFVLPHSAS